MAKIGKKKFWKTALIVGLSLLTVTGAVGAGIALTNLPETKEVGALSWKVGGLNDISGKETDDNTSIVMTKAVGMDGLNVEISEETGFTGTYKAYYYTENGSYLGCSEEYSTGAELQDTFAATVKIVYTPELSLAGKERLYFWDVYDYADDLTVTYNREQGEVLGATHMRGEGSSNFYSYATLGDKTYAITVKGEFYYSYDNIDWYRIEHDFGAFNFSTICSQDGFLFVSDTDKGFFKYTPATETSEDSWEEIQFVSGKTVKGLYEVKEVNGNVFALGLKSRLGYNMYMYDNENSSWTGIDIGDCTYVLEDMIYVNGEYVVVGRGGSIYSSEDLNTWVSYRNLRLYNNIFNVYHDGTCYMISGKDFDGNPYIYVGGDLKYLFRAETNSQSTTLTTVYDIESFNGKLFAVVNNFNGTSGGEGELWMSEDHGGTWKVVVDSVNTLWSLYSTEDMLLIGTFKQIYYLREF